MGPALTNASHFQERRHRAPQEMSATQTKTLSPAELAKLEHAFASEPGSDAYKPLAEAYMSMSRYMEAMVVCKKGVKAHPQSAEPRVLLARVYAEQGKDKKALEELQGALQIAPSRSRRAAHGRRPPAQDRRDRGGQGLAAQGLPGRPLATRRPWR